MSTLSRAPWLFALLLLAPACSTTIDSGDAGGGGASEPKDPPPKEPESRASHCGFGHGSETVLVATKGKDLVFVRDDGSTFVAASFPTQGGTDGPSIQLGVAGGFVAAIGFTWGGPGVQGRAVLLDADGHVRFSEDFTHGGLDSVFVSELGDATFGDSQHGRTLIAHADGTHQLVDAVVPLGPPDADGSFGAMTAPSTDIATYGWARAGQGLTPLELGGPNSFPLLAGDELVYVGEGADGSVFVRETASSTKTFAFPLSSMLANVSDTRPDGWVALRGGSPERTFIAAPNAGATHVETPAGQEPFGMSGFQGMRLGSDAGELLFIGRDSAHGGLFRTRDGGATWTATGPTFSKITSIAAVARGGTYVVGATDEPGYFEESPWQAPTSAKDAPDHVGPAVFAMRPADGIEQKLPVHAGLSLNVSLDSTGLCAAFVGDDGAVRTFDVKSGHGGVILHGDAGASAAWLR